MSVSGRTTLAEVQRPATGAGLILEADLFVNLIDLQFKAIGHGDKQRLA
jgi:hypothetical protein